jgi:hypothetical protein
VSKILLQAGVRHVVGCDSRGALHTERDDYLDGSMSAMKRWYAEHTNDERRTGAPADVIDGTDLFIGLSGARVMPAEALSGMADDAMVFAMANPTPEVTPEEAAPYARIIATGRSDYPNQINNVLAFPGLFRGALDVRAHEITEGMKVAAARGIAEIVLDSELREDYIVPSVFNRDVAVAVAAAVAAEATAEGAATADPSEIGYAPGTPPSSSPSTRDSAAAPASEPRDEPLGRDQPIGADHEGLDPVPVRRRVVEPHPHPAAGREVGRQMEDGGLVAGELGVLPRADLAMQRRDPVAVVVVEEVSEGAAPHGELHVPVADGGRRHLREARAELGEPVPGAHRFRATKIP